jgi:cysteine desulfurase
LRARVYLDWNATAPLRPEARNAMIAAMDVIGNPSSVHAEGRAARALVERARAQVADALGALGSDIVFTSGATEAAALACVGRGLACAGIEHEAVLAWCDPVLPVDALGRVTVTAPAQSALQLANSETGILQDLPEGLAVSDLTQGFGKLPIAFDWLGVDMGIVSAHKLGGPKGAGALVLRRGLDLAAQLRGGGQEMGRRAGTENLVGIAGFGAAAEAAARDLAAGLWERVAGLRNILDHGLSAAGIETISVGKGVPRLPNTLCLIAPGWKGETQVMQMDLSGFAVSAGSACSSGRVRDSRVLRAMGFDAVAAGSAIRLSLGPGVTEEEILRFVEAWGARARRQGVPGQGERAGAGDGIGKVRT